MVQLRRCLDDAANAVANAKASSARSVFSETDEHRAQVGRAFHELGYLQATLDRITNEFAGVIGRS